MSNDNFSYVMQTGTDREPPRSRVVDVQDHLDDHQTDPSIPPSITVTAVAMDNEGDTTSFVFSIVVVQES